MLIDIFLLYLIKSLSFWKTVLYNITKIVLDIKIHFRRKERVMKNRKLRYLVIMVITMLAMFHVTALAADGAAEYESNVYGTIFALVPPVVAIVLALITKEVYSSLFIGIVTGALLYANFKPALAYTTMVEDGFIGSVADSWNAGILVFLVVLGIVVVLMNRAGGSAAYGQWASRKIKTRKGAMLATFGLGCLIFVDDYFNCLTVGSVMRPVTDKHKISRAKLAYLIDATAAPICMIAPISSWAAAISGVIDSNDIEMEMTGMQMFVRAIPYNLYSLLTIAMIILITLLGTEFGPMKKHEDNAVKNNDLYTTPDRPYANAEEGVTDKKNSKIIDLVLPVIILIVLCVFGLMWSGGIFDGAGIRDSFAECDASIGLSLGSIMALVVIILYYLLRRVLSFKECMESIPQGFKSMVPAILILIFAWTLSSMTSLLGADIFVKELFDGKAASLKWMLPAIVFIVSVGLSFATGTSWGTFGILLPIVLKLSLAPELMLISTSACLAGSVCGDHCSPISDTTIMASTGAQSNHINHVSTQLPYVLLIATISFIGYIIAGAIQNIEGISSIVSVVTVLGISLFILLIFLIIVKVINGKTEKA